ncbi:TetR/AcrR family transcriptional regulator [Cohaesibacter haloalkalitolerans]|uniref:TetR/AcrR family transcriptional regulator n=1 Tax=Cohaesibacter haloalkalitolerans TaxID=1162980 RepID=UPI001968EAE4|nr:TetR/AcrR family transcriptional regulator [Cohaesibacter haloalkalitolerans]
MADTAHQTQNRIRSWKQDPEAVRADILREATSEFAKNGLAGTRVKDIADRIQTSRRMIFYYFGDKEGLYRAVLEEAYRSVREAEEELNLDGLPPLDALVKLVEFTFDHHRRNEDFIRLVMNENILNGQYMRQSSSLHMTNTKVIKQLSRICAAGEKDGVFRAGLSPLELHWEISALSFFNVSNRATFSNIFGNDLFTEEGQIALRDHIVDCVISSVRPKT